jgi:hypothetical protein
LQSAFKTWAPDLLLAAQFVEELLALRDETLSISISISGGGLIHALLAGSFSTLALVFVDYVRSSASS